MNLADVRKPGSWEIVAVLWERLWNSIGFSVDSIDAALKLRH
jgi:hypothetical protein